MNTQYFNIDTDNTHALFTFPILEIVRPENDPQINLLNMDIHMLMKKMIYTGYCLTNATCLTLQHFSISI